MTDIDECENATASCPEEEECQNTVGSFTCVCLEGFSRTNGRCIGNGTFPT